MVTATRIPTPMEQVGSAISVITAEELARRQVRFVADALRDIPGVAVSRSGGLGGQTEVRLRGSESNQTLVLIDGVEVNDPDGDFFNFNSLLALQVERIEVLRGPQSVLYGSSAIGGVINIITEQAEQPLQGSVFAETGSFSTQQYAASVGSRGQRYDILLSASHLETEGISAGSEERGNDENDGARNTTLMLKGGIQPLDNLEFNIVGRYVDEQNEFDDFFGGFERPVVDADKDLDGEQYFVRGEAKLTLLEGDWEHLLSSSFYNLDNDTLSNGVTDFSSEAESIELTYQSNYFLSTPQWGIDEHTFTVLVEHKIDEAQSGFFAKNEIENTGLSGIYSITVGGGLFLSAGGRYDYNDEFENTTTYRFTGAYVLEPWGTRLHGSFGKAVKNPTLTELFGFTGDFRGNPNLEPEQSKGWDLGVEQAFWNGRLTADVTYFSNRVEDIILGSGRSVENLNGESELDGIEVTLTARPLDNLDIVGAYTYTDAEDPDGNELVRRADHMASLTVNYRFLENRANINLGVRFNGDRVDDAFDPVTFARTPVDLDSFTLVDINGAYQINDHLELFGRIENLFAENYEEVLGYGGIERGFYGGLKGTF
jgi:vitamin B12 transporter